MKIQAKIALFTLLLTGVSLAIPQQKAAQSKAKKKSAAVQPAATQAMTQPAPAPAPVAPQTPEQMPATPAKVTMSNGMLSIVATNSTLGDVLNGIHKATGAAIDAPPAAGSERVAVNIGPAEPHDALQELFEGSKFDYIIVGSPENGLRLQKVILTPRSGGSLGTAVANNNPGGRTMAPPTGYQPPPDTGGEDETYNQPDEEVMGVPEPASPEQIPNQPGGPQAGQLPPDPNQQGQEQQQKTPEQLLQELQRIQRQQRMDQQGQGQQQEPPPQPQ